MNRFRFEARSIVRNTLAGFALTVGAVGCAPPPDGADHASPTAHAGHEHAEDGAFGAVDQAYVRSDRLWLSPSIPVCWENPAAHDATERGWVRDAVADTWEAASALRFTGWGSCNGGSDGIRIRVADAGPHVKGLGRDLDGMRDGMVLNFTFQSWSRSCAAPEANREHCIRSVAIHEFGHAIGLAHEHNRADRAADCHDAPQGTDGDFMIGAYDRDSVMNYCNPEWNGGGVLSRVDAEAARLMYGLTGDRFGSAVARCDFDGDGFEDLAVGVPSEDTRSVLRDAGAVQIVYGGPAGLTDRDALLELPFNTLTIGGDLLGSALATGDFDGDGACDLAAGMPGWLLGRGGVTVTYGGPNGLDPATTDVFTAAGLPSNNAEAGDRLGATLAATDFDADGRDDLVVGAPGEDIGAEVEAGALFVLYGSAQGVTMARAHGWNQNTPGMPGAAEAGDRFAAALAAGDFDDDGHGDIAVGIPGEDLNGLVDTGAVLVVYGSPTGIGPDSLWLEQGERLGGSLGAGDRVGAALAAADIDQDDGDDLVIGAPGETVDGVPGAGRVHAVLGWHRQFYYERVFDQSMADVPGMPEAGDGFGDALTAADFDGDSYPDVAVGVPQEAIGARAAAGAVALLEGSFYNLRVPGGQRDLYQDLPGSAGMAEAGDLFGGALVGGDFDGDGAAELAVGVPGEAIGATEGAGMVHVFDGPMGGVDDASVYQDLAGLLDASE